MIFEKDGIKVEIVLKSINTLNGAKMMTLRCHYPRIIHAEVKTHSQLKTNSASSRAVPVKAMNESILNSVAMPVRFGANQGGMQDRGVEHDGWIDSEDVTSCVGLYDYARITGRELWGLAADTVVSYAKLLDQAGYHKQICNRLTEPFQWMDVVMSGSEWANFLWLRCDEDADPTLQVLADLCLQAYLHDSWDELGEGDWHLPFVQYWRCPKTNKQLWYTYDVNGDDIDLTLEEAQLVSMSVAAQASFRKADATLEKALKIKDKLFGGRKVHASPSEHQAKVVRDPYIWPHEETEYPSCTDLYDMPDGITHITVDGKYGSGNLIGWIQLRQLIDNNYQSDMSAVIDELTSSQHE